tara:strand:+ start:5187 stop:5348 length:162 start_codon:yes stop_codon:yes gene_type:complete
MKITNKAQLSNVIEDITDYLKSEYPEKTISSSITINDKTKEILQITIKCGEGL